MSQSVGTRLQEQSIPSTVPPLAATTTATVMASNLVSTGITPSPPPTPKSATEQAATVPGRPVVQRPPASATRLPRRGSLGSEISMSRATTDMYPGMDEECGGILLNDTASVLGSRHEDTPMGARGASQSQQQQQDLAHIAATALLAGTRGGHSHAGLTSLNVSRNKHTRGTSSTAEDDDDSPALLSRSPPTPAPSVVTLLTGNPASTGDKEGGVALNELASPEGTWIRQVYTQNIRSPVIDASPMPPSSNATQNSSEDRQPRRGSLKNATRPSLAALGVGSNQTGTVPKLSVNTVSGNQPHVSLGSPGFAPVTLPNSPSAQSITNNDSSLPTHHFTSVQTSTSDTTEELIRSAAMALLPKQAQSGPNALHTRVQAGVSAPNALHRQPRTAKLHQLLQQQQQRSGANVYSTQHSPSSSSNLVASRKTRTSTDLDDADDPEPTDITPGTPAPTLVSETIRIAQTRSESSRSMQRPQRPVTNPPFVDVSAVCVGTDTPNISPTNQQSADDRLGQEVTSNFADSDNISDISHVQAGMRPCPPARTNTRQSVMSVSNDAVLYSNATGFLGQGVLHVVDAEGRLVGEPVSNETSQVSHLRSVESIQSAASKMVYSTMDQSVDPDLDPEDDGQSRDGLRSNPNTVASGSPMPEEAFRRLVSTETPVIVQDPIMPLDMESRQRADSGLSGSMPSTGTVLLPAPPCSLASADTFSGSARHAPSAGFETEYNNLIGIGADNQLGASGKLQRATSSMDCVRELTNSNEVSALRKMLLAQQSHNQRHTKHESGNVANKDSPDHADGEAIVPSLHVARSLGAEVTGGPGPNIRKSNLTRSLESQGIGTQHSNQHQQNTTQGEPPQPDEGVQLIVNEFEVVESGSAPVQRSGLALSLAKAGGAHQFKFDDSADNDEDALFQNMNIVDGKIKSVDDDANDGIDIDDVELRTSQRESRAPLEFDSNELVPDGASQGTSDLGGMMRLAGSLNATEVETHRAPGHRTSSSSQLVLANSFTGTSQIHNVLGQRSQHTMNGVNFSSHMNLQSVGAQPKTQPQPIRQKTIFAQDTKSTTDPAAAVAAAVAEEGLEINRPIMSEFNAALVCNTPEPDQGQTRAQDALEQLSVASFATAAIPTMPSQIAPGVESPLFIPSAKLQSPPNALSPRSQILPHNTPIAGPRPSAGWRSSSQRTHARGLSQQHTQRLHTNTPLLSGRQGSGIQLGSSPVTSVLLGELLHAASPSPQLIHNPPLASSPVPSQATQLGGFIPEDEAVDEALLGPGKMYDENIGYQPSLRGQERLNLRQIAPGRAGLGRAAGSRQAPQSGRSARGRHNPNNVPHPPSLAGDIATQSIGSYDGLVGEGVLIDAGGLNFEVMSNAASVAPSTCYSATSAAPVPFSARGPHVSSSYVQPRVASLDVPQPQRSESSTWGLSSGGPQAPHSPFSIRRTSTDVGVATVSQGPQSQQQQQPRHNSSQASAHHQHPQLYKSAQGSPASTTAQTPVQDLEVSPETGQVSTSSSPASSNLVSACASPTANHATIRNPQTLPRPNPMGKINELQVRTRVKRTTSVDQLQGSHDEESPLVRDIEVQTEGLVGRKAATNDEDDYFIHSNVTFEVTPDLDITNESSEISGPSQIHRQSLQRNNTRVSQGESNAQIDTSNAGLGTLLEGAISSIRFERHGIANGSNTYNMDGEILEPSHVDADADVEDEPMPYAQSGSQDMFSTNFVTRSSRHGTADPVGDGTTVGVGTLDETYVGAKLPTSDFRRQRGPNRSGYADEEDDEDEYDGGAAVGEALGRRIPRPSVADSVVQSQPRGSPVRGGGYYLGDRRHYNSVTSEVAVAMIDNSQEKIGATRRAYVKSEAARAAESATQRAGIQPSYFYDDDESGGQQNPGISNKLPIDPASAHLFARGGKLLGENGLMGDPMEPSNAHGSAAHAGNNPRTRKHGGRTQVLRPRGSTGSTGSHAAAAAAAVALLGDLHENHSGFYANQRYSNIPTADDTVTISGNPRVITVNPIPSADGLPGRTTIQRTNTLASNAAANEALLNAEIARFAGEGILLEKPGLGNDKIVSDSNLVGDLDSVSNATYDDEPLPKPISRQVRALTATGEDSPRTGPTTYQEGPLSATGGEYSFDLDDPDAHPRVQDGNPGRHSVRRRRNTLNVPPSREVSGSEFSESEPEAGNDTTKEPVGGINASGAVTATGEQPYAGHVPMRGTANSVQPNPSNAASSQCSLGRLDEIEEGEKQTASKTSTSPVQSPDPTPSMTPASPVRSYTTPQDQVPTTPSKPAETQKPSALKTWLSKLGFNRSSHKSSPTTPKESSTTITTTAPTSPTHVPVTTSAASEWFESKELAPWTRQIYLDPLNPATETPAADRSSAQLRQRVWTGIPSNLRPNVWARLVGNRMGITLERFRQCLESTSAKIQPVRGEAESKSEAETKSLSSSSRVTEQIRSDVTRTFADLSLFSEASPLTDPLCWILEAFVALRPDIGYIQGMTYLAALITLYSVQLDIVGTSTSSIKPEAEACFPAFVCFANIMDEDMQHPSTASYSEMLRNQEIYCIAFESFVFTSNKSLAKHLFKQLKIPSTSFVCPWFMSFFARILSLDTVARIWDNVLLHGPVFMFRTGVALLNCLESRLLTCDDESALRLLIHPPKDAVSEAELFDHIARLGDINNSSVQKALKAARAAQQKK